MGLYDFNDNDAVATLPASSTTAADKPTQDKPRTVAVLPSIEQLGQVAADIPQDGTQMALVIGVTSAGDPVAATIHRVRAYNKGVRGAWHFEAVDGTPDPDPRLRLLGGANNGIGAISGTAVAVPSSGNADASVVQSATLIYWDTELIDLGNGQGHQEVFVPRYVPFELSIGSARGRNTEASRTDGYQTVAIGSTVFGVSISVTFPKSGGCTVRAKLDPAAARVRLRDPSMLASQAAANASAHGMTPEQAAEVELWLAAVAEAESEATAEEAATAEHLERIAQVIGN